jgi:CBS domain containing-hemolysin-like protein
MSVVPALFLIAGLLLAVLAATALKALVEISWHDLEEFCRLNERQQTFDEIHDRFESVTSTTEALQIVGTLTSVLLAALGYLAFAYPGNADPATQRWTLVGIIFLAVLATLLATVWFPREIARCWGSAYLVRTWPFWRAADRILRPLQLPSAGLRIITRRLDGRETDWTDEEELEDEILSIVTEGQHDGLLQDDVREMIAGVIELDDADAADIMTPRSKMDALPIDMEWSEMLQFVVRAGRTRIPVYDKNLDDIVGLLYIKDLLAVLAHGDNRVPPRLKDLVRDVARVPRSTRLDELLDSFLKTRNHLAIVVDEFMHVVGLVTIEDVLEEIVGEIVDESDAEEPADIRWINSHSAEIQGRAHVAEVNEALGVQLPTGAEFDTVGGFILHQFGRIPQKGEVLHWQEVRITVQEATRRRIERVRMDFNQKPRVASAK